LTKLWTGDISTSRSQNKRSKQHILKVKRDGTQDVLIGGELRVDEVGIIHDVSTEDETSSNREDEVHGLAKGDEDTDEAGHDWTPRVKQQVTEGDNEIVLKAMRAPKRKGPIPEKSH
jgi:hypothetical protein